MANLVVEWGAYFSHPNVTHLENWDRCAISASFSFLGRHAEKNFN